VKQVSIECVSLTAQSSSTTTLSVGVRGKPHPTSELRLYPLLQSVQGVQDLANVVVFDSNPLSYETDQIFCFCNKHDDGSEMIMCETCKMYYHSYCIGKSGADLDGIDYVCGYCAGVEDEEGNQLWEGELKPGLERSGPRNRSLAILWQC
jgi:hypothetical protein